MGHIFSQEGKEAASTSTIAALKSHESPEIQKIAEKKEEEVAKRKKKPKSKTKKKNAAGDQEHKHELEVEIAGNAFALLADQQGQEASTIVAMKIAEVNKIAEEKKKEDAEKKKQKKCFVMDDNKSLDGLVEDHDRNVSDSPGDGQATQEQKVCVRTVVSEEVKRRERHKEWLAREGERQERHRQWLAREAERQEGHRQWLAREAERKERLLAREERKKQSLAREVESENQRFDGEEGRKEEMTRKTLIECEEQKAYEKQKVEKLSLSIPVTSVREATLDDIHTKQKSEDEMVKKYTTTKNYWKVKTMNIEEFSKLATEGEGKDSRDTSIYEGSLPDQQEHALPDEENTMEKAGPAFEFRETSFPVLGKVTSL